MDQEVVQREPQVLLSMYIAMETAYELGLEKSE